MIRLFWFVALERTIAMPINKHQNRTQLRLRFAPAIAYAIKNGTSSDPTKYPAVSAESG